MLSLSYLGLWTLTALREVISIDEESCSWRSLPAVDGHLPAIIAVVLQLTQRAVQTAKTTIDALPIRVGSRR